MLDWNHGKFSRTLGLGCAVALATAGLSLGTANAATQDKDSVTTEKVEKRVIIREVDGSKREPLSAEMREKIAKCEGQPFEANADLKGADGKQQRTRVVLCTKGGDPKMSAERLEKAATRIESDSDMSPEAKAKILAELRAKIAELRSR